MESIADKRLPSGSDGTFCIERAGEPVHLRPDGALWLPEHRALLVADLHLGKAQTFRRLGVPVPGGTTRRTLALLDAALADSAARRLVMLGDFLHARQALSPALLDALHDWRRRHARLTMTLVRGNHDRHAGDPPASLGIEPADEPLMLGPWALCHHPQAVAGRHALAGHWHPCVTLNGPGGDRLRLPCFWFGTVGCDPVGVLPACGAFTGMAPVRRQPGDRVYVLADGAVCPVP